MRNVDEMAGASRIATALCEKGLMAGLGAEHHLVGAQAMFLAGDHAELTRWLPSFDKLKWEVAHYLRTDLLNPFTPHPATAPAPADASPWTKGLSAVFVKAGLAPVVTQESHDGLPPFDLLAVKGAAPGCVGGELVTVIMPCYRPDSGLITSIRSISRQTWADLEILVVDDASGPDYADLFAAAVALDPRARLISMPQNGGSYRCRAAAIDQSTGSLITFQDADDWSHPSRIERQVTVLHEQSAPMSRSHAIRAKDDLTHQWLGYRPMRANASSLLVRRTVLEQLGGFLPIRKGADSEFADRVRALAGPIADTRTPLAITRLRSGSLSRGDFTYSWFAPDRLNFRDAFMAWHRRLAAQRETEGEVRITTGDLDALPFAVPPSWVRGLEGERIIQTDLPVTYLGNFSTEQVSSAMVWLQSMIGAAGQPHSPTGWWHHELPVPQSAARPSVMTAWLDKVVHRPHLVPVSRIDRVNVGLLALVDPGALPLVAGQDCHVDVREVQVWLTPAVVEPGHSLLPEDLLGISDLVYELWSTRPQWVLAPFLNDDEREHVRSSLPGLDIAEATDALSLAVGRGAGM
ncbi:MAG: glycosyltransferase family A protein [Ornithinimicrobium sp.]|uniref:glycosyltransferase family 2 protein n=1 Tax=Ornithinimicrobium sp. TaxID=1977084 RepID=UPI0026DFAF47|nr:glycosyltransferase family A protein [Ornithinimicrobium sp.]MDO5739144.1 glycosyltransferase family A protein [Ornithinimicrobium sp.]